MKNVCVRHCIEFPNETDVPSEPKLTERVKRGTSQIADNPLKYGLIATNTHTRSAFIVAIYRIHYRIYTHKNIKRIVLCVYVCFCFLYLLHFFFHTHETLFLGVRPLIYSQLIFDCNLIAYNVRFHQHLRFQFRQRRPSHFSASQNRALVPKGEEPF